MNTTFQAAAAQKPAHRKHNKLHDYRSRCIYHITLVVSDRCKVLGTISDAVSRGELPAMPHTPEADFELAKTARVELSPLGFAISEAIRSIPLKWATLGVKATVIAKIVMPDHVHFVLFIEEPSPHWLPRLMRGFKQGCNKLLAKCLQGGDLGKTPQPNDGTATKESTFSSGQAAFSRSVHQSPQITDRPIIPPYLAKASPRLLEEHSLFAPDFDETRLRRRGQLAAMIAYVHNNPAHRWLRAHRPEWLLPTRGIVIAGRSYDAIGNVNLLALPRIQSHARRIYSPAEHTEHQRRCYTAALGGYAVVSPFVNGRERAVRDAVLFDGGSVIELVDNGFTDVTQCPGDKVHRRYDHTTWEPITDPATDRTLYEYCTQGQVLLLVPSDWPHVDRKGTITRAECKLLNGYAEEITGES